MLYKVATFKDTNDNCYDFFVRPILRSHLDWGIKRKYSGWSGPNGLIYHTETPNGPEHIEDEINALKWGVLKKYDLLKPMLELHLDNLSFKTPNPGTLCASFNFKEKFDKNINFASTTGKLFFHQLKDRLFNIEIDSNNVIIDSNNEIDLKNSEQVEDQEGLVYPFAPWIKTEIEKSKKANHQFAHLFQHRFNF